MNSEIKVLNDIINNFSKDAISKANIKDAAKKWKN